MDLIQNENDVQKLEYYQLLLKKSFNNDRNLFYISFKNHSEKLNYENLLNTDTYDVYFEYLKTFKSGLFISSKTPCNLYIHHLCRYIHLAMNII